MPEATIALIAALATLAVNGVAAALGGLLWWRVRTSDIAWKLLRLGQAVAGLQALAAGVLAVAGYEPPDGLYWLYALAPVAIGFIAEQIRVVSAEQVLENRGLPDSKAVGELPENEQRAIVLSVVRRELGVLSLAALTVALLALRAALIV